MIGATAGSYRILRQIGEGGMGAVYLGEHTMLGRPAAIKILLPSLSQNREMVGRFFNEARATTAIRHPGIVEIYDFGFLPDGAAYIAMEMLDGESLASRLQRVGRLPVSAAVDIGRQVAAALHAAHSLGITHRDLKPDNMFLVRDPEIGERVKLLDFGIAKLVTNDSGNRTRTGVVMGTPVYMSPEQCRGTAALDGRADLYSLGCVLYELVAGRPPFVAESAGDIIAHHLYFPPDPVRRHEPSVPDGLEQLIMALLAKDPAMRPGSAVEVSGILDRWRTIAAAPSGSAMRATPVAAGQTGRQNAANVLTTLSGSAAAVATAAGTTGHGPSNKRWVRAAAIGVAVVAAGAIAVVVMTRRPEPSATVAATTPSAATAPAATAT
ncbi:MAG TPA: serine/threonine-protein kinase, partial [Kofleriaceae bacterium]